MDNKKYRVEYKNAVKRNVREVLASIENKEMLDKSRTGQINLNILPWR
jgi:hypothetical protein